METQNTPTLFSLTLCSRIKNALRQRSTTRHDPAPQAPPQDQQAADTQASQQKPEAAAATQFHRFQDLPVEIRLMIWHKAARCKRYVVLNPPCNSLTACLALMFRGYKYHKAENKGDRRPLWTSPTPPPALLSVNFMARDVALKTWQRSFACDVFPAMVYMNFDHDDVVIGAGARVNKNFGMNCFESLLRLWSKFVAEMMLGAWEQTPDVEKIQRVVACGDFMRKRHRITNRQVFMTGLKSLTIVKIGNLPPPCDCPRYRCRSSGRRLYTKTMGSGKGAPLLSLGGMDFVKTTGFRAPVSWPITQSFAELELMDFVGDSAEAEEVQACWAVGPEASGWKSWEDDLPTRVHLGPGRQCVRRSKWRCETTMSTNVWYAI